MYTYLFMCIYFFLFSFISFFLFLFFYLAKKGVFMILNMFINVYYYYYFWNIQTML